MGVDLRLLPQYVRGKNISQDVLSMDRDSQLLRAIKGLSDSVGHPAPRDGFHSFLGNYFHPEEGGYGTTRIDRYGEVIKSVKAGELKTLLSGYKTENWTNKAIFAYVKELPDELEVWLYWC